MNSTITIHYKHRAGPLFSGLESLTRPMRADDKSTVLAMINEIELTKKEVIVWGIKKHTIIETDLSQILR